MSQGNSLNNNNAITVIAPPDKYNTAICEMVETMALTLRAGGGQGCELSQRMCDHGGISTIGYDEKKMLLINYSKNNTPQLMEEMKSLLQDLLTVK